MAQGRHAAARSGDAETARQLMTYIPALDERDLIPSYLPKGIAKALERASLAVRTGSGTHG
ncbi:hypothetical protein [Streptomyces avidinii]